MKPLQFSYSFLSQFDNCPDAARHLFVLRDYKKSYTVQGGIDDHRELENRLKAGTPLPAPLAKAEPLVQSLERAGTPEVEIALAVTRSLTPSDFWTGHLRGKYDVVMRWPEKRRAFIGDWKTGKVRESSDQLEIGALLLMANDPAIDEVTGVNLWLQGPQIGARYTFTRAGSDARWVRLLQRMTAIERLDPERPWELRQGPLCGYCPVKSCQFYRGG